MELLVHPLANKTEFPFHSLTPPPPPRCVFIFGRGIHTAADAAHSLVTEISPQLAALTPPPLLSCLHMLDEHIGHIVLWLGYFTFWAALLRGSRHASGLKPDFSLSVRTCAAAAVMGATHAVALIESSHPELCFLPLLLPPIALCSPAAPPLLRAFTVTFAAALAAAMLAYVPPPSRIEIL